MAEGGLRGAKAAAGGGRCWALLLPLLLPVALAEVGAARQRVFPFPLPIKNLAVAGGRVLVASGHCVYQLEAATLTPPAAGPLLFCVSRTDAVNKILLSYAHEGGGRLITCWSHPEGTCYRSRLGGPYPKGTVPPEDKMTTHLVSCSAQSHSVGKVFHHKSQWFLAVATTTVKSAPDNCTLEEINPIYVLREDETRVGEENTVVVAGNPRFVDLFLWGKFLFFPFYNASGRGSPTKMAIVPRPEASQNLQFFQTALQCAHKPRILSSSQLSLPGGRAFWIGIFSSGEEPRTPTSTALCLFDLKQVLKDAKDCPGSSSHCVSKLS